MPRCEYCGEELLDQDDVFQRVVASPCGHVNHGHCLLEWVTEGNIECPADDCRGFVSMGVALPLKLNKSQWQENLESCVVELQEEVEKKKKSISRLRRHLKELEDELEEMKSKARKKTSRKKSQPKRKN